MDELTLAVIPARGGSKRIPRKNLRELDGKPLIAHTIEQANSSSEIDRAIVSTDDEEIVEVSREHGAEVPFKRPKELATDTAPVAGTITHALDWAKREGFHCDCVCSLQVTSPLRTPDDIDEALTRLNKSSADSCVSISTYESPPQWAVIPNEEDFLDEYFDSGSLWSEQPDRSQDIPELYHPNGAIFAAAINAWEAHESFYTPRTIGYQMPPERSFDIDEPWELELIRTLMK